MNEPRASTDKSYTECQLASLVACGSDQVAILNKKYTVDHLSKGIKGKKASDGRRPRISDMTGSGLDTQSGITQWAHPRLDKSFNPKAKGSTERTVEAYHTASSGLVDT